MSAAMERWIGSRRDREAIAASASTDFCCSGAIEILVTGAGGLGGGGSSHRHGGDSHLHRRHDRVPVVIKMHDPCTLGPLSSQLRHVVATGPASCCTEAVTHGELTL